MENDPERSGPLRRDVLVLGIGATMAAIMPVVSTAATKANSNKNDRRLDMGFVKTKDGAEIFYKDWGSGQPIVFHHGWPLSSDDWDAQMLTSSTKASGW